MHEDWGLKPKNWNRTVTSRQIEYIERLLKKHEFDFDEAITCAKADEYYEDKVRHVDQNRCTPAYNLASRGL